jgi:hypothetical protein
MIELQTALLILIKVLGIGTLFILLVGAILYKAGYLTISCDWNDK